MLKRFVKWLDGLLIYEGSATVVKAVVGIMSFAVLLGAVLGNAAIKAGALVAAILLVLSAGLLLLADRRELVRQVESYRAIVSQLAHVASGDRHPAYRISDWDEFVAVEPNGDGRRRITMRAEVSSNDLWALLLIQGCGWPQPAKFRHQVRVAVRRLLGDDAPGVSLATTSTWVADGKSVLIIHFPEPPRSDTEITIAVEVSWPGMCAPLMRGQGPDKFTLRFATPVAHARYRVVLPRGFDAYFEPVGFDAGNDGLALATSVVENGQSSFVFEGRDLPMRRPVGMRLELKGKGSPL